jgi:hypothetical protein
MKLLEEYSWQDEDGKRQALVIDTSGRKPIDAMISTIQAKEVPEFKLGSAEHWLDEPPPWPPRTTSKPKKK